MSSSRAPRYQGKITSWKDEQGFGFIAPNGGGPAVFVHISAFAVRGRRPANDDIVTYHLGANDKGPRAEQVAFVPASGPGKPAGSGKQGALIVAGGFLALVGLCVLAGRLPLAVLCVYLVASAIAFVAYYVDKSAARNNTWRTSENKLHVIALGGGWPGALIAQATLRHKSQKASFRKVFRGTVALNCLALAWMLSPAGRHLLS